MLGAFGSSDQILSSTATVAQPVLATDRWLAVVSQRGIESRDQRLVAARQAPKSGPQCVGGRTRRDLPSCREVDERASDRAVRLAGGMDQDAGRQIDLEAAPTAFDTDHLAHRVGSQGKRHGGGAAVAGEQEGKLSRLPGIPAGDAHRQRLEPPHQGRRDVDEMRHDLLEHATGERTHPGPRLLAMRWSVGGHAPVDVGREHLAQATSARSPPEQRAVRERRGSCAPRRDDAPSAARPRTSPPPRLRSSPWASRPARGSRLPAPGGPGRNGFAVG